MSAARKPARRACAPAIHIGPAADTQLGAKLVPVLERIALRAVELGRTEVGVQAVKRLGRLGVVKNVTISNSTFSGLNG